ncbi:MAG: cation:proton antiporter [Candidatus Hodarchaeales archaeon]|jgi:Kef-type K+ transport system membrane component KefB
MILETINETGLLIGVLEIGAVIIFSLIVARVLGNRGIPQVLGLITAGVVIRGLTISLGFPTAPTPELIYLITTGALGFIGYNIGAHIDIYKLRDASWGLPLVLIGESIGAFLTVAILVILLLQDFVLALLLGSIAMATAPAATSEVIREYNAHGSLSQTILFIVAFDDILAIIFFNIALGYAESTFVTSTLSIFEIFFPIAIEVIGSVLIGTTLAFALRPFHIEGVKASESAEYVFPSVLICISLAGLLHFSVILSCIVFGFALSTLAKCENSACVRGVERLSSPVIALFFIIVGYEMELNLLVSPLIFTILLYFFARAIGKSTGSYVASSLTDMPQKVTRYLPFSLLSQAGVALGLAAYAYTRLFELNVPAASDIAIALIDVIAVSVLIAEIIGPLLLKKALIRAKEIKDPIQEPVIENHTESHVS